MSKPPTIGTVLDRLALRAFPGKAADWDAVGLQVGDPARPAGRVAVCHEVTDEVCDAAAAAGIDLLITYHPLVFTPLTRLVAGEGAPGRVLRLAEDQIAVAVVHTDWDVAPGGAADSLALALGLVGTRPFGPIWGAGSTRIVTFVPGHAVAPVAAAMADAGAGTVGGYSACSFRSEGVGSFRAPASSSPHVGRAGETNDEPEVRLEMVAPAGRVAEVAAALVDAHPYEEPSWDVFDRRGDAGFAGRIGSPGEPVDLEAFAGHVAGVLRSPVRVAGDPHRSLATVAVVPGSGGSLLREAAARGADAIVTGDLRHHEARGAIDRGLALIDPGHVATERPGLESLYAAVAEIVPVIHLGVPDPDPWSTH